MDLLQRFSSNLIETFADVDLKHAIRLVIIIGGYWLFRQAVQRFLAKRQLEQQVQADRDDKAKEKLNELVEDPENDNNNDFSIATGSGSEAKFGWGKRTRKQVKRQEKIIQETLENLHSETPDDDADIADLLED